MNKEITFKYKVGRIVVGTLLGVAGIGAIKGLDYYSSQHPVNMSENAWYSSFDPYGLKLNKLDVNFKEIQDEREKIINGYKDLGKIIESFKETMEDLNSSLRETNNIVH